MKSSFDKLNLRPQERRLVVVVGLVIFILLNIWFVFPYFDDWGKLRSSIDSNRARLDRYQREIANRPRYEARQRELESTGSEMLNSELDLLRLVQSQAAAAGVQLGRSTFLKGQGVKTNQFFQEGGVSIEFSSGGKEIVDFLVGIAAQNAMVRVRDMNLRPDASQTRLGGTMVFIGNYQPPATNRSPSKASPAKAVAAASTSTP